MQCLKCQNENREGRRFCAKCGAPLAVSCSECGFSNEPDEEFCGGCGRAIATADHAREQKVPEAERRQLTVMFCDLVGSTALAERLDPEELREVLAQYQDTCAAVIHRFDGHIARYVGDGLLIYFGYPQAHEDDAQRAVSAGLSLVDAICGLEAKIANPQANLSVRIGITTGLVVAGDIGSGERLEEKAIVGETPNVAARLQALAAPSAVLIGAATQRLVEGMFDCEDLGEQQLKGISKPVGAYQVRTESNAPSRFEARAARGLVPIVGREEEVALLLKRWGQANDGEGQVILLSGEAGIGKSRIAKRLQECLGEGGNRVLYYGSAYHQNSALYPAIEQLERVLHFDKGDTAVHKCQKLEAVLTALDLSVEEHAPVLASLLSLPFNGRYRPLKLTPQELKNETFRTLVTAIEQMAAQDTVLMVVEDAHWIDPSTMELISLLIEELRTARFLLLIAFRPEFQPPWGRHPHVTTLVLNRLSRKESAMLVAKTTRGKALPDGVLDQIIAKTDGVPLFVEELTKTMLESDPVKDLVDSPATLAIPVSLHDSLMARLDRLGSAKEVAELAATCGRTFSPELLLAVSALKEDDIESALRQLLDAELIYRRGFPPNPIYEFKHALVQDTAYQMLLKSKREHYHRAIAEALERQFSATSETQPEVVAHHYTEAGLAEQAIPYWHRAGQRAAERSGNLEAVTHLTKGLELVEALEETPKRTQQELDLYLVLGPTLIAARHFADPSVGQAYARASELCKQLDDKVHLPLALRGRQVFHRLRGELSKARDLGEQLVSLAERQQDRALLVGGYHALGQDLFSLGDLIAARRTTEQGITLFDPTQHRLPNWPGGQPGEQCYLYAAFALWMLGYPDQALRRGEEALAFAEELPNPHNLINTLAFVTLIQVLRREPAAAQQRAKTTMEVSTQHKNAFLAWGITLHGWAVAAQGQAEDGTAEIDQGIAAYRATDSLTWLPCFLAIQAETCGHAKRTKDGLASLAEAFLIADRTEERCWQAELNRIKGELLLIESTDGKTEAENCLLRALDIARRQQAKSWELRAAVSLARLWCDQGKRKKGYDLLAPIYDWFTEGFDTVDLKEAKSLLEQLS